MDTCFGQRISLHKPVSLVRSGLHMKRIRGSMACWVVSKVSTYAQIALREALMRDRGMHWTW